METILFYWFAFVIVATSILVITLRNPMSSAFFLILSLVHLAGMFALLQAHFLAIAQVLVYAGAVMVLFIFVIMLLNINVSRWGVLDKAPGQTFALLVGCTSLLSLGFVFFKTTEMPDSFSLPEGFGTIEAVSRLMFMKYLVPFEIISILLLVATIGAVLLAKRVI